MANLFAYIDDSNVEELKFKALDGSDLSSNLADWTEFAGYETGGARQYSSLTPKDLGLSADRDALILPVGDGGFAIQDPGTLRGINHTDLSYNNDNDRIATGDYAVQDGYNNLASGKFSKASGQDCNANIIGEYARGTSKIYEYADNQIRQIQWKLKLIAPSPMPTGTGVTSPITMYLDNPTDATQLLYGDWCAENITLKVVGHLRKNTSSIHVMKTWKFEIGLLNDNGTLGLMAGSDVATFIRESGGFGAGLQTTWDATNHYGWDCHPVISSSNLLIQITLGSKACMPGDYIYFHAVADFSHVKAQTF